MAWIGFVNPTRFPNFAHRSRTSMSVSLDASDAEYLGALHSLHKCFQSADPRGDMRCERQRAVQTLVCQNLQLSIMSC
jgi:hypothetical protein